jgi:N-acetylneuraminic acid mutarotase
MDSLPEGRCASAICSFNDKIYVFGGVSPNGYSDAQKSIYEYDPLANTWTQKADMPYYNAFCGIAVLNNIIYLIGGTTNIFAPPISTVMAYEPATESWIQLADMHKARAFLNICVVDSMIYAFGGGDENLVSYAFKDVEVYDPATNTWTIKEDMPMSRLGLNSFALNGNIYLVGGVTDGLQVVATNEMYDPLAHTWIAKSPLQEIRQSYFLGMVEDKVYAIGGSYPDPANPGEPIVLNSVEEYDPSLDQSSTLGNHAGIQYQDQLLQVRNYPNPFNANTTLQYKQTTAAKTELIVYNLLEQKVRTLVNSKQQAGNHQIQWDGKDDHGRVVKSGVYIYIIRSGKKIQTGKMILIR